MSARPAAGVLLVIALGLGMLAGCTPAAPAAPAAGAPAEVVSAAPVCARLVGGQLVDAPCPAPRQEGRS